MWIVTTADAPAFSPSACALAMNVSGGLISRWASATVAASASVIRHKCGLQGRRM
jgi:hypothetical protein